MNKAKRFNMSKITIDREVLEQVPVPVPVFELEDSGWEIVCDGDWIKTLPVGTKLYTLPSAQPQQEPVALRWVVEMIMSDCGCSSNNQRLFERLIARISQYERANTPPQPAARKPLTGDEITVMAAKAGFTTTLIANDGGAFSKLARAIEAAHGIKDTP